MKYKSYIVPQFKDKSFSYTCFSKKNKNGVLYEVNITGYEIADKNYRLRRTGMYNYLINCTVSGRGVMEYRGERYEIRPGDLVFVDCKDEHVFYPETDNWEFFYVHLSGLGVNFLYDSFVNATGAVFRNYPCQSVIKNICKLHSILNDEERIFAGHSYHVSIDDEITLCNLSSILYDIIIDVHKNVLSLRRDIPYGLSKALEFIKDNYNKKITLEEIAAVANLSKYHFDRLFKQYLGTTVYAYIKELRFDNARWLLESTRKKLIDIAMEVGYSDIQALNKIFKAWLGVTPSEYRKSKYHY